MRLVRYRVTAFRSVKDSGWIDAGNITALIGTNESGKTNLLLPLWKLNPSMKDEGEIDPLTDYPRSRYGEIRDLPDDKKPCFITADFEMEDDLVTKLVEMTGDEVDDVRVANVSRRFDGTYFITFPNAKPKRSVATGEIEQLLQAAATEVAGLKHESKADETMKQEMLTTLTEASALIASAGEQVESGIVRQIDDLLKAVERNKASIHSTIKPRYEALLERIGEIVSLVSKPHPDNNADARKLVLAQLPKFVYYSNYGNLDSEIYLPHVIENMNRTGLGTKEAAKARTLKVLFKFVGLKAEEIRELGEAPDPRRQPVSEDEVAATNRNTKEREILLDSAASNLTKNFREWWKQGEYRFDFGADGNHFRIWVSDDLRPDNVELENRSTGLQWFLSFYLIFLVESEGSHQGAILLLDEPGLSLHPIAQKALSEFFENLSITNQLIYTTHSPFLVNADQLDRVRVVYVNEQGYTEASSDLRRAEKDPSKSQSIYAVHAALGLSVSETFLDGCTPVVVEGQSDQHYLSAIKNYLIGKGMIQPQRELVFAPSGGVKGITTIAPILAAKEPNLPYVILDSDKPGRDVAQHLKNHLYQAEQERIILIGSLLGRDDVEMEDLFPTEFIAKIASNYLNSYHYNPEGDFSDAVVEGEGLIYQIRKYAKDNDISLREGWKVELAAIVKERMRRSPTLLDKYPQTATLWQRLFANFVPVPTPPLTEVA